jgi:hypothetical protein
MVSYIITFLGGVLIGSFAGVILLAFVSYNDDGSDDGED